MFRYKLNNLQVQNSASSAVKKFLVLCIIFSVIGMNYNASSSTNIIDIKRTSERIVLENSLLWKIEKSDRPSSYLFGTFHLLPLSDFEISDRVLTAFELTDQLILEIDLNDPAMQREFMQHVTRDDTLTLENALSPTDFNKLNTILTQAFGMNAQMVNRWHPAMVGTFLIKHFIEGAPASYDAALLEMANNKNREALGLETVEEQLHIFDQIPYSDQIKDLNEMLNDEAKVKRIFSKMVATYKKEDINGLLDLFLELNDTEKKRELLLNKRNRTWISRIDSLTVANSSFVAVGAGHLGGKHGLINLLRQEGFKVTPVK